MSTEATVWVGAIAAIGGSILGAFAGVLGAHKLKKLEDEDKIQKIKKAIKDEMKSALNQLPSYRKFVIKEKEGVTQKEFSTLKGTTAIKSTYKSHFAEASLSYESDERTCIFYICEMIISINDDLKAYPRNILSIIKALAINNQTDVKLALLNHLQSIENMINFVEECLQHYLNNDFESCLRVLEDPNKQKPVNREHNLMSRYSLDPIIANSAATNYAQGFMLESSRPKSKV